MRLRLFGSWTLAAGVALVAAACDPVDGGLDDAGGSANICEPEAADPAVDASLVVDLTLWPEATEEFVGAYDSVSRVDADCRITGVEAGALIVTTRLRCDPPDEQTRDMAFALGRAESPVAWAQGDEVHIEYERLAYADGYGVQREELSMRRLDGTLLVATRNQEPEYPETFAPVTLEIDEDHCAGAGAQPHSEISNLRLDFDNGVGDTLTLGHQQRGELVPADGGRDVRDRCRQCADRAVLPLAAGGAGGAAADAVRW